MQYAQETFLSVAGLAGILAAIVLNSVTLCLARIGGRGEDLVDLISNFVAKGKGGRTGAGFMVLIAAGAILGFLYGGLLMVLEVSKPSLIIGVSLVAGCVQGLAVTGIIARTMDTGGQSLSPRAGFISPVAVHALAHAVFGLVVGGMLALLASTEGIARPVAGL